jgi:hypothetical protein
VTMPPPLPRGVLKRAQTDALMRAVPGEGPLTTDQGVDPYPATNLIPVQSAEPDDRDREIATLRADLEQARERLLAVMADRDRLRRCLRHVHGLMARAASDISVSVRHAMVLEGPDISTYRPPVPGEYEQEAVSERQSAADGTGATQTGNRP